MDLEIVATPMLVGSVLFGVILGMEYSQLSVDEGLVHSAVDDPEVINLRRRKRAIQLLDIRGCASWSERGNPETVVDMLNEYYQIADEEIRKAGAFKPTYTVDEIGNERINRIGYDAAVR